MAKRCEITGKGVMTGNNVSHANNKTRRRFLPNLQQTTWQSEALGRAVRLRIATSTIRSIEKHGGLDAFLKQARNSELGDTGRALKREIESITA
jgi:large subunit ribosomal protein L28